MTTSAPSDQPPDSTAVSTGYIQGPLKWAIALTAAVGAILEVIDTSIVNVALTDIQSTLGATISEIGWVVTGYAIANVILIPLSAWLGDRFGKKSYFVFSMVEFTVTSFLCGLSVGLPLLLFLGRGNTKGKLPAAH
jgi:MFS transporter, DHA2 family, multidrug resistance protein